ncbi:hypothetical protein [Photorhabdus bodei]|uniref:Uncharacterized protein n=1 Tax=Photorhabdus bodei TaxID=2029681 RepID=A0AAW6BFC4_9GAMM|nr:hypothetical protein [Photorhabdus bodei]MCC8463662.1 hypothetical protein [Photorhabdus bodei]MDB6372224.1 hypothetical protein [Photorhabdus bodei]
MYSKIWLCDKCGKTLGFGTYPPDDGSAFICVYTEGSKQLNISICKVCFVSVFSNYVNSNIEMFSPKQDTQFHHVIFKRKR